MGGATRALLRQLGTGAQAAAMGEWSADWLLRHGGFVHAFTSSLSMILVSEIGDETFIIAAILAMRHPRSVVFAGAMSALAVMTVLSTLLGMLVPTLFSQAVVNRLAAALYTCFGLRLAYVAATSEEGGEGKDEVELGKEVGVDDAAAAGRRRGLRLLLSRLFSAIYLEAFVLVFLAEWGDRSQIATVTLASHLSPVGVTAGAVLGHGCCTGLAVMGGQLISRRISQRAVAASGSLLFFAFAVSAALYGAPGSGEVAAGGAAAGRR